MADRRRKGRSSTVQGKSSDANSYSWRVLRRKMQESTTLSTDVGESSVPSSDIMAGSSRVTVTPTAQV